MFRKVELVVILVLVFCCAKVLSDIVNVDDCGDGVKKPERVNILDCKEPPCPFVQGRDATVNITFMAENDHDYLRASVKALTMGIEVPFLLPHADACKVLINNRCPIEAGEIVTYPLKIPILAEYPEIDILLTFRMSTDIWSSKHMLCFKVAAKVVKP